MFNYNRSYNYFCVVFLLHSVILLALSNKSAEAQILRPPASDFNKHRIVQPVVHHGRTKREITSTRDTNGAHHSGVVMKVPIDDREFVLDLQLNKDLIPDNHVLRYQEGGKTVTHKPKKEDIDLCQYSGTVRGMPGSWVAVSTCRGVRGVIFDGKEMRYIEPAEGDEIQSQHYVYDHSELNSNHRGRDGGGVMNNTGYGALQLTKHQADKEMQRTRLRRSTQYKHSTTHTQIHGPYNANKNSRYVELVMVADNREYIASGRNLRQVHNNLKDLINIVNSVFAPLNIFIALVGVEVWTDYDKIRLSANSDDALNDFLRYRGDTLVWDQPNDIAHFLTRQTFDKSVVGKAYPRTICTHGYSGGIATNHTEVMGLLAMTVAHEMGHNFGMGHDLQDCECPDNKCIMSPTSSNVMPTMWSTCSLTSLVRTFELGLDYCLRNKPKSLFESPTCGNGFVEPGEQCDCGTMVDRSAANPCHACCHPDTCMLRHNATCGAGACCDLQTCRPRSAGTQCRAAERECDLPEYCTGHSEFCPDDVYKMDTTPCGRNDDLAYCVRGWCRSHLSQCRLVWGPTGHPADRDCYTKLNVLGEVGGNCGSDPQRQRQYRGCSLRDAECGVLHCNHLTLQNPLIGNWPYSHNRHHIVNNNKLEQCHAIADPGNTNWIPGMVPDGAKCGDEMMCLDHRCVSVVDVRATRGCPSNCSGHGVCNSEGHCHCDAGFAPPLCELPGSEDSGPATDSGPTTDPAVMKYTMVVIYVIFLGIVPAVLLISLLYYYRRDLALWWKQPMKSCVPVLLCGGCCDVNTKRTIRNRFQDAYSFTRELLTFKSNAHKNAYTDRTFVNADTTNEASKIKVTTIDMVTKANASNSTNTINQIRKFTSDDIHIVKDEPIYRNVNTTEKYSIKPIRKINKDDICIIPSSSNKYNYAKIDIQAKAINKINKPDTQIPARSKDGEVSSHKEMITEINTNVNISNNNLVQSGPQIKLKPTLKPVPLKENKPTVNDLKPTIQGTVASNLIKAGPQIKLKPTLKTLPLNGNKPTVNDLKPTIQGTVASNLVKAGPQIKLKPTLKTLPLNENKPTVNDLKSNTQGTVANMRRMFDTGNDESRPKIANVKVHGFKK